MGCTAPSTPTARRVDQVSSVSTSSSLLSTSWVSMTGAGTGSLGKDSTVPACSGRTIRRTTERSVTLVITSRAAVGGSLAPTTRTDTEASLRELGARGRTVSHWPASVAAPGKARSMAKLFSSTTATANVPLKLVGTAPAITTSVPLVSRWLVAATTVVPPPASL
jgi:hypothetical protein